MCPPNPSAPWAPSPTSLGCYLAELLQFLPLCRIFSQRGQEEEELRAGWGRDVQEEGEGLVERAGGQAAIRDPQALRAWEEEVA